MWIVRIKVYIIVIRPKKKNICVWGNMTKKRGSVGRFLFFNFFLVGPSLTSACTSLMYFEVLRFGAGDHGRSGFIIIFSLNGLILEDWKKKVLLYILSKFMK